MKINNFRPKELKAANSKLQKTLIYLKKKEPLLKKIKRWLLKS